jgi:Na+/melibiose symporter-like transporter
VERPSIKEGFRALLTNKPVLRSLLARVLGGFSISAGNGQQDYFIDVLGSATLLTAVNVPSGFVGSASYALVQPLRRRYSSKALWVFEDIYTRVIWIAVFLLGLPNKNYQKRVFMGVLFGLQAFFEKAVFGVRKVINTELNNEAMDYCEWKNGYRVEATTSVVINLVTKIQEVIMRSVRLLLLNKIGYRPGIAVGTQSERTKLWMFALCTGVPVITGALAVVPKFFYPLSGAMRTQMYNELHDRRGETVRAMTGDE